jgi:hypothetical protein
MGETPMPRIPEAPLLNVLLLAIEIHPWWLAKGSTVK